MAGAGGAPVLAEVSWGDGYSTSSYSQLVNSHWTHPLITALCLAFISIHVYSQTQSKEQIRLPLWRKGHRHKGQHFRPISHTEKWAPKIHSAGEKVAFQYPPCLTLPYFLSHGHPEAWLVYGLKCSTFSLVSYCKLVCIPQNKCLFFILKMNKQLFILKMNKQLHARHRN